MFSSVANAAAPTGLPGVDTSSEGASGRKVCGALAPAPGIGFPVGVCDGSNILGSASAPEPPPAPAGPPPPPGICVIGLMLLRSARWPLSGMGPVPEIGPSFPIVDQMPVSPRDDPVRN